MNYATALRDARMPRPSTVSNTLLRHLMAWIEGESQAATARSARAAAAALYARAARYESSQPSFAADLRAAAESLERNACAPTR
jgi:hypothetical protein